MKIRHACSLFTALLAGWLVTAETVPFPPGKWKFHAGRDYPGASGAAELSSGKPVLHYDFTKGGRYVGMEPGANLPGDLREIGLVLRPSQPVKTTLRVTDANGRVFQTSPVRLEAGKAQAFAVSADSRWATSWGGDKSKTQFTLPIRSLAIQAHSDPELPGSGTIAIESADGNLTDFDPATLPKGKPFHFSAAGWTIDGSFAPERAGQKLTLRAEPGPQPCEAELSVTLPQLNRDWVMRFQLTPGMEPRTLEVQIPRQLISNAYNCYQLRIGIDAADGSRASTVAPLAGKLSGKMEFDRIYSASEIPFSRIGTQVHFAYRTGGGFAAYAPYRELTDKIAAAGFKYIRDTALLEKDESGDWRVRPSDLEWIRYARQKGLNVIVIFRLYADDTVDNYLKRADAMVRDTRDYVNIYELGNEPFGMGNWRQKHGGPWNGKENDNSTSPWVKEHLKYTNALADRFKKLYPECTVIGLGANTPTNYRYLDIGVTENLDGVTDHPYSYCLPPEKVPYGWRFEKRDGVRVGSENDSFRGLIEDYHRKFAQTGKKRTLWLTEFGYTTFWASGSNEKARYGTYTEEAQAVYIVRRLLEALSLPIEQISQYCFVDKNNSRADSSEGNFGLLRTDYSCKPSFYAVQRLNSRLAGFRYDPECQVEITASPRQNGNRRDVLVSDWDGVSVAADNGCMAIAFRNGAGEQQLAIWSLQPYSREFNNRVISLRLPKEFNGHTAVAQDLITGITYDINAKSTPEGLLVEHLSLRENPLLIRFAR